MSETTDTSGSAWGDTAPSTTGTGTGADGATARAVPPAVPARRAVRVDTVLWGAALLAFAVYMIFAVAAGSKPDPFAWVTGSLIVGGVCLVVIGIAAAVRRR